MLAACHLFHAKHEDIVRLARYLAVNPFGLTRQQLVVRLLLRILP